MASPARRKDTRLRWIVGFGLRITRARSSSPTPDGWRASSTSTASTRSDPTSRSGPGGPDAVGSGRSRGSESRSSVPSSAGVGSRMFQIVSQCSIKWKIDVMAEPQTRSSQWYAGTDRNAYIHRAWMRRGLPANSFDGRPHIAIANTASDLTPCNAHLNEVADSVKQGVYEAGGIPLNLPVVSLGETLVRP